MVDFKELEFAARSIGYTVRDWFSDNGYATLTIEKGKDFITEWDPFNYDVDSCLLVDTLGLFISWYDMDNPKECHIYVDSKEYDFSVVEYIKNHDNNKSETRRAAVLKLASYLGKIKDQEE